MPDLEELTTHCIRCGFCIESCPTYVATGNEMESPRGRIYLVRSAIEGKLRWQEDVREHLENCLGCLACQTACPSGVQYDEIFELAKARIESEKPARAKGALLAVLSRPKLLKLQLELGAILPGRRIPSALSKLLSGQPPEADRPEVQQASGWPALDEAGLPKVRGEVYLLEGCAMRVLFPRVHEATRRLLRRVGYTVREAEQGCCGALHAHNGYLDEARELALRLSASIPLNLPLVVNSAGCGSALKDYGRLFDLPELVALSERTVDVAEFLLREGLADALAGSPGVGARATYHDACHLANGQGVRSQPRQLFGAVPGLDLVPLQNSEVCCGSAGIYNLTRPSMARLQLEEKVEAIGETRAGLVILGNPGCHAWIAQGLRERALATNVLHTAELLESSFSGLPPGC